VPGGVELNKKNAQPSIVNSLRVPHNTTALLTRDRSMTRPRYHHPHLLSTHTNRPSPTHPWHHSIHHHRQTMEIISSRAVRCSTSTNRISNKTSRERWRMVWERARSNEFDERHKDSRRAGRDLERCKYIVAQQLSADSTAPGLKYHALRPPAMP
jgi:hypothetical protein